MDLPLLSAELKRDEGLSLKPYTDTTGHLSIGFGTNLSEGITLAQAEWLLHDKLVATLSALSHALPWLQTLDDVRQRVIGNLAYNLGVGGLLKFTHMLSALQALDYEQAGDELKDSIWYGQVGGRGPRLVARLRTGQE